MEPKDQRDHRKSINFNASRYRLPEPLGSQQPFGRWKSCNRKMIDHNHHDRSTGRKGCPPLLRPSGSGPYFAFSEWNSSPVARINTFALALAKTTSSSRSKRGGKYHAYQASSISGPSASYSSTSWLCSTCLTKARADLQMVTSSLDRSHSTHAKPTRSR